VDFTSLFSESGLSEQGVRAVVAEEVNAGSEAERYERLRGYEPHRGSSTASGAKNAPDSAQNDGLQVARNDG
jgi:hypothetical protein